MEKSKHAATVLECKEPLCSRKGKEELIIKDEVDNKSLLFELVDKKLMVGEKLLQEEPYQDKFEVIVGESHEEEITKSSIVGTVEEEATDAKEQNCQEILLFDIRKKDLTTGDEVIKEESHQDEFINVKEEFMEERISEDVNSQLLHNQVTSVKEFKKTDINVTDFKSKHHPFIHSTNIKPFKCSNCNYECNKRSNLKMHMLTHSNIKQFKCPDCAYECNFRSRLKRHSRTHSNIKRFKCSDCNYACIQKENLKAHMLTHSNINRFKCSDCEYECKRKGSLKVHMLTHSNMKQFSCSFCNYKCNQREKLQKHRLVHSNIKPFRCSVCDFECKLKYRLKAHMLTHSNIKRFKCSDCEYECKRKANLMEHMLTHSDIKQFKCSSCDYACTRRSSLNKHMLTHSRRQVVPKEHREKRGE